MSRLRHRDQRRFHYLRHSPAHARLHLRGVSHGHRRKVRGATGKARHRHRRLALWLGGGVAILVVVLAVLALDAYRSVERARMDIDLARSAVQSIADNPRGLLTSSGRAAAEVDLRSAASKSATALNTLQGSFGLTALGFLPVLRTQRRVLLHLVDGAKTTAVAGVTLLRDVSALVRTSSGTRVSVPQLDILTSAVARAAHSLAPLSRPVGGAIGPVASAQRTFDHDEAKIDRLLARAARVLAFTRTFLGVGDPQTYLVAGENNAEMRDQGAVLSLATLTTKGGSFTLGKVASIGTYGLTTPVALTVPRGTARAFKGFEPTQVWQSTNATATFAWSGKDMAAMFEGATGQKVDGVVALDVPALASLLALTGPVAVPGITQPVDAANLAPIVLDELYQRYPSGSQVERRDDLSAVASAVVQRMRGEHIDLTELATTLARDIAGRHLLVWDADTHDEALLRNLGAAGAVDTSAPERTFHIAVENGTASKLDYFVSVSIAETVWVMGDGQALVRTSVTVANHAPAGQSPSYQLGPDYVNSFEPGQYIARVYLWSPHGSVVAGGTPESGLVLSQQDASVMPGAKATLVFTTLVPHAVRGGRLSLRVVPQPRLDPEHLSVTMRTPGWRDDRAAKLSTTLVAPFVATWRYFGG